MTNLWNLIEAHVKGKRVTRCADTAIDLPTEYPLAPQRAGFFNGVGVCTSASHWDLSGSPEAHQNYSSASPELCSGVHQKGCDLEGVEGATPPTQLTHSSPLKQ